MTLKRLLMRPGSGMASIIQKLSRPLSMYVRLSHHLVLGAKSRRQMKDKETPKQEGSGLQVKDGEKLLTAGATDCTHQMVFAKSTVLGEAQDLLV
jgi:hypothetical protein